MVYEHQHQVINRPGDVSGIVRAILAAGDQVERDQEHFWCVGLDSGKRIKFVRLCFLGSLDSCSIHPREVLRPVLIEGCASFIVAHNHPGGRQEPSTADKDLTERLRVAAEYMLVPLVDHVIVTDAGYYSFAEEGAL